MAKSKPQNRPKQALGRGPDGRILPGSSGNPGGRPKAGILFREEAQKRARQDSAEGKVVLDAWVKEIESKGEDWVKASELLANYAFGRPVQGLEITGAEGGPIETSSHDLSKLSTDELRAMRALLAKTAKPK